MNRLEIRTFEERDTLDRKLAATVAEILADAIASRGEATLVVSGGGTPVNFFHLLSLLPLEWQRVSILLADERWLPPDHPDSNEKLVRDALLINEAAAARLVPLKTAAEDAVTAEATVEDTLAAFETFDLVILGMGGDGHTASLFPGSEALARGLDFQSGKRCIAVTPPVALHQRMSLTLPRLLDTRKLFIHITGADKLQVLERAQREGDAHQLPIAAVLGQTQIPVTVFYAP